jgi:hypothetical protein
MPPGGAGPIPGQSAQAAGPATTGLSDGTPATGRGSPWASSAGSRTSSAGPPATGSAGTQ